MDAIMLAWQQAPMRLANEVHVAIQKTVLKVEANAKREAPVNKRTAGGNLRQSIRSSMSGPASGVVEVGSEYGLYVHEGTKPHMIRAKNRRSLANTRTGQFFGRTVNHPGTRANPFLQRAVDVSEGDIDQYFINAVNNIFK